VSTVVSPGLPYGFDDDEATGRLLRSRPPDQALAWVADALGAEVRSVRALRGGRSSAMHLLAVTRGGGQTERVVLRRYVRPELNIEAPDIADREQRALRFVEQLPVSTPRLLAHDPTGSQAGVPAVLMSHLPGQVEWSPIDLDTWLRRLAEVLPLIHQAPLPAPGVIRAFAPYEPERYEPPPWMRRPRVWHRALEIFHGPTLDGPASFIHRDFHPGNVLWRYRKVSGVVDWQAASIGPVSVDVGHCRFNLLSYGLDIADRFTAIWEEITGATFHPWADIVILVSLCGSDDDPCLFDAHTAEAALSRAVANLS
jgi:aminoglycoside phosphotransferase (APT) family kinase protein